ncbi:MAG: hypothetical protein KatS3mg110_3145 [Pirellulaceae bacterium]|nr:MAG: hypothetical protein KatS3mg110_3145 [Pirellulaceae bacterium]
MASPDSRQTTALEATPSNAAGSGSLAGPSRRSFWKAVLAGFLVTLAVWGLVRIFRRSDMEPLTRDELATRSGKLEPAWSEGLSAGCSDDRPAGLDVRSRGS